MVGARALLLGLSFSFAAGRSLPTDRMAWRIGEPADRSSAEAVGFLRLRANDHTSYFGRREGGVTNPY